MQNYKQISEKYAFSLDNRQIAFLGTGILGMLLLFFLLGVLYGTRLGPTRGFSRAMPELPVAATATQAAPETPESEVVDAPVETVATASAAAPRERVFELGGIKEEDLSESSPAAPPPAQAPAAREAVSPKPRAADTTANAVVAAPAPDPEPNSGAAAAQMSGDYTVQVGSFTRAGDADRLVQKLERAGYPAYMARGIVNGSTYYRVRIGKYQTRDEASRMASRVKRAETMDAYATRVN